MGDKLLKEYEAFDNHSGHYDKLKTFIYEKDYIGTKKDWLNEKLSRLRKEQLIKIHNSFRHLGFKLNDFTIDNNGYKPVKKQGTAHGILIDKSRIIFEN